MSIQPSDTISVTNQMSPVYMDSYAQYQQSPSEGQSTATQMQYQYSQQISQNPSPTLMHPLEPRIREIAPSPTSATTAFMGRSSSKDSIARALGSTSPSNSPTSSSSLHGASYLETAQTRSSQLQNINARVTRPYDYTEGYHFLMKYLPSRCVLVPLFRKDNRIDVVILIDVCSLTPPSSLAVVFVPALPPNSFDN